MKRPKSGRKKAPDSSSHGTVLVKLKAEDVLLADLQRALGTGPAKITSLSQALEAAADYLQAPEASQRSAAFLRAFLKGLPAAQSRLGQVFPIALAQFPAYAAREEKSCFVEWIEIYFDCPLTRQGITLVDTPGADSINGRHTAMNIHRCHPLAADHTNPFSLIKFICYPPCSNRIAYDYDRF